MSGVKWCLKDATEDRSKIKLNTNWHMYLSYVIYILALNGEVESAFLNEALAILTGVLWQSI